MPNTDNGKHRHDDMLLKPRTRLEDMGELMVLLPQRGFYKNNYTWYTYENQAAAYNPSR